MTIGFYLFPDFQFLDLSGPLSVFQAAGWFCPRPYDVAYFSAQGGPIVSSVGLPVDTRPVADALVHTWVIVGGYGVHRAVDDPSLVGALGRVLGSASRVASVCTGAFLLAATGALDGLKATTHWRSAASFQGQFPRVRVEADRIYCQQGRYWTSAGVTAGIDLALALVEADWSPDVARRVAQELVVYYRRPGGQSQFSALMNVDEASDRVQAVVHHVRQHLDQTMSVEALAEVAALSPRQFSRVFRAETGTTPAKMVERLRVEAARVRVETSDEPIEMVALATGFGDPERMRRAFWRWLGHGPQTLRRLTRQVTGQTPS